MTAFKPELWSEFRFFALVKPKKHILPVRTMYNGRTPNIGNNYLTSVETHMDCRTRPDRFGDPDR